MTSKTLVSELRALLLRLSDYIGPATYQFVKLLDEADIYNAEEWYHLSRIISLTTDEDALESSFYDAMEQGTTNVWKIERIVDHVLLE